MDGETTVLDHERQEILEVVAGELRNVIGEEWARDLTIAMDTSFANDLEVESIEIVALSERLHDRYGESIDLAGWLSSMDLDEIMRLTVGQLVDRIAECR
jgi:acyl carrier protein